MSEKREWRKYAQNLHSEEIIWRSANPKTGQDLRYKCRSMIFRDVKKAIMESEPHGNAERRYIPIAYFRSGHLVDEHSLTFSPTGNFFKKADRVATAISCAEVMNKTKRVSADEVARNRKAWEERRAKLIDAHRRKLIEAEKIKILAKRNHKAELAKVEDIHGSW